MSKRQDTIKKTPKRLITIPQSVRREDIDHEIWRRNRRRRFAPHCLWWSMWASAGPLRWLVCPRPHLQLNSSPFSFRWWLTLADSTSKLTLESQFQNSADYYLINALLPYLYRDVYVFCPKKKRDVYVYALQTLIVPDILFNLKDE